MKVQWGLYAPRINERVKAVRGRRSLVGVIAVCGMAVTGIFVAAPANAIQQVSCPTNGVEINWNGLLDLKCTGFAGSPNSANTWLPDAVYGHSNWNNWWAHWGNSSGGGSTPLMVPGQVYSFPGDATVDLVTIV